MVKIFNVSKHLTSNQSLLFCAKIKFATKKIQPKNLKEDRAKANKKRGSITYNPTDNKIVKLCFINVDFYNMLQ